jgi:predicted acetyltransferase
MTAADEIEVVVRPATEVDRPVLWRLLQLYLHDFSELEGNDLQPDGEFAYPHFDVYWTDADRHPFLFEVDGAPAGFALVRSGPTHDLAEFFVVRKHRRHAVGRRAAVDVFARFPGEWQVRQLDSNPGATRFWRAAIPYPFADDRNERGPVQRFTVSANMTS